MGLQESLGHPRPHPYSTDASPWVFRSRLAVAEGKPQPSEWSAPTWLTHGKWQSTHATYSLPWHLNSATEEATGNSSSYPLSPAHLPAQRTEETKCLHLVQSSSRNSLETEMGRLDSVSGVSTSRSLIIWFQVLWDTKTQNLFWVRNRMWSKPPFHQEKTSKSYSRSRALETRTPGSPPPAWAPSSTLWCCLETWTPSVFETPPRLQCSIRIETKDS